MKFPFNQIKAMLYDIECSYHHINYSGCGVMAYILAYHLKKVVPVRIRICGYNDRRLDELRANLVSNCLSDWNDAGIYIDHAWVEFKINRRWYAADTNRGVLPISAFYNQLSTYGPVIDGVLTMREICELGFNDKGWNSRFDRKNIPRIKRKVSKHLKQIFQSAGLITANTA